MPDPLVTFPVIPSGERRYDAPNWRVRKSLLWKSLHTPRVTSDVPSPLIVPLACCSCTIALAVCMLTLPPPNEDPKILTNRIIAADAINAFSFPKCGLLFNIYYIHKRSFKRY
jgi:hypothetical protein